MSVKKCDHYCYAGSNSSPLEGKIIHGNVVPPKMRPYVVSIRNNDRHICGGSLISENEVLTAAHCVILYKNDMPRYKDISVVAGTNSLEEGGISRAIIHIDIPNQFFVTMEGMNAFNIALLVVSS